MINKKYIASNSNIKYWNHHIVGYKSINNNVIWFQNELLPKLIHGEKPRKLKQIILLKIIDIVFENYICRVKNITFESTMLIATENIIKMELDDSYEKLLKTVDYLSVVFNKGWLNGFIGNLLDIYQTIEKFEKIETLAMTQ